MRKSSTNKKVKQIRQSVGLERKPKRKVKRVSTYTGNNCSRGDCGGCCTSWPYMD